MIEGCYLKIGKFGKGADLQYHDMLEGSLFRIADQAIDLIYTKYLKAKITYEKDVRAEIYPYPREAVREAIYNALAHNNYARSVPIQIRIEDKAMYISNSCILPSGWNETSLFRPHKSVPFNPGIANAFYRAGYIESWGRGIQKICEECKVHGIPAPEYTLLGEDITVKFTALQETKTSKESADVLRNEVLELIKTNPAIKIADIALNIGVTTKTVDRILDYLKNKEKIKRVGGKRFGHWEIL